MRRPIRILIAAVLLAVALLSLFARSHSLSSPHIDPGFHTPSVSASCAAGVTVNMVDYRPEGPNHLTVTIDGVVKADLGFGASYSAGYANPDPTKPHTYHVVVSSADGAPGNLDVSGTIDACVAASTAPPTTAPPTTAVTTTVPASTVPAATTTPAVTTAPPATMVAPTTRPVVRTLPGTK